jgi:hypothetical protein
MIEFLLELSRFEKSMETVTTHPGDLRLLRRVASMIRNRFSTNKDLCEALEATVPPLLKDDEREWYFSYDDKEHVEDWQSHLRRMAGSAAGSSPYFSRSTIQLYCVSATWCSTCLDRKNTINSRLTHLLSASAATALTIPLSHLVVQTTRALVIYSVDSVLPPVYSKLCSYTSNYVVCRDKLLVCFLSTHQACNVPLRTTACLLSTCSTLLPRPLPISPSSPSTNSISTISESQLHTVSPIIELTRNSIGDRQHNRPQQHHRNNLPKPPIPLRTPLLQEFLIRTPQRKDTINVQRALKQRNSNDHVLHLPRDQVPIEQDLLRQFNGVAWVELCGCASGIGLGIEFGEPAPLFVAYGYNGGVGGGLLRFGFERVHGCDAQGG